MPKTINLSRNDVLHIAKLSQLAIPDENVEKFLQQLTETISYVENLDELDTQGVEPTSHSTNLTNVTFEDGTRNERGLSQQEATSNAKQVKNGKFVVKRLM